MLRSKRMLSAFLAAVMVFCMIPPAAVSASETTPVETVIQETILSEVTEETAAPTETAAATEETTVSTEATVPATEETTAPTEETVPETEETTAPTEETVPVTEETTAPTEETVPVMEETTAPTEETVPETEETTAPTEEELLEEVITDEAVEAVVLGGDPSCKIVSGKVSVSVQVSSGDQSDNGMLYLFAVPTYVDTLDGQTPVAFTQLLGAGSYQLAVDLNSNTAGSLLYSKFYVAIKSGGVYTALNSGSFITNPEVLASSSAARTKTASKKGIHMSLSIPTDLETLGIKQGYFNISLADFISNTATDTAYTYNGKTYYYNTTRIGEYDNLIGNMSRAGIAVTIALLNEYQSGYEYLLHPGVSYRSGTVNYAINTSTQQGLETVAAATHFLAERYNGKSRTYGKVDNWIVGNEVNDNLMYYYMGHQDIDTFVQEYLQTFRVMYTAVKSAYSNANVYLCLQHRWNTEDSTGDYGGRNFIDKFSAYAKAQGDMDWGLSYHPYSFPMNDPEILNDSDPTLDQNGNKTDGVEVTDSAATPIITMKNINLLTDYFHSSHLLNSSGKVRSIIMGEMGYTSYSNIHGTDEEKQAANIALAYYKAEMNEDIDAFLLRTHTDENEGSPYYKFGLRNQRTDGRPGEVKYAYEMYKYIDTTASLKYTEFAKAELGISDWSAVVPGWNAGKFNSMGTRTEARMYTIASGTNSKEIAAGMLNQWEPSYNVFEIGQFDYEPVHYPNGVAVVNSFAYFMDYQGIEKHFSSTLNLSEHPYLAFDLNIKPMNASYASDKLELKVRLYSGNDVYDSNATVDVNKDYAICLDLTKWAGRGSIDTIEIMLKETVKEASFAGTFTAYNLRGVAEVVSKTPLDGFTGTEDSGTTEPDPGTGSDQELQIIAMYRLYNPNSGEHFYTGSTVERDNLVGYGWQYEGVAWNAPTNSGEPVYRLYNPNNGDHHYTMSLEERDMLVGVGWQYEGVCWNSAAAIDENIPLYRLFNPNADCGSHHYTGSTEERDMLVSVGWIYEGIGWFGIK